LTTGVTNPGFSTHVFWLEVFIEFLQNTIETKEFGTFFLAAFDIKLMESALVAIMA